MAKTNIHKLALNYFIKCQKELCKKYNGKELLMHGAKVIGAYDSFHEAAANGRRLFGSGNFSVQECIPGEEAYTVDIQPLVLA
ncbi:MAG: hypothetical protein FWC26_05340 [Fibromonadales bacterium]|nr:hypothetical protein [Fibromonadales bacterium]